MAASAGSLVVSLGLDAAQYTKGLTKAEADARKLGETIGTNIRGGALLAASALAGIGTAAIAAAAAFNSLLDGAAKFQDLAEETGAAAVDLASLAVAAGTAGVSMESVAGATVKLTKSLVGVDDESKAAGAALGALGIKVADFKKLDPVSQYEAVSKALGQYADGAEKTAVAVALFGKAGAEQLKVLKALEEQGGRTTILTAEQIAQADDYLDKQAKLRAELGLYASAVATQFIAPTNALMGVVSEAAKEMLGLSGAMDQVGANNAIRVFAENVGRALAGVVDNIATTKKELEALVDFMSTFASVAGKLATLDISGARAAGQGFRDRFNLDENGFKRQAADGTKAAETFVQAYDRVLANNKRATFAATDPRRVDGGNPADSRPKINFSGAAPKTRSGAGASDDPTKKLLENALKGYENAAKEEEDILRSRNKMLDLYNNENLISTAAYFSGKRAAQELAVSSQTALYDKEIEALRAYQAKAGKATDREAAQGKINDLTQKKTDLYRQAGEAALEMGFAERRAMEGLARQIDSVNADVLELTGNLAAASKIRLDAQYKDLNDRLTANGDTSGLAAVQRLKDLKTAQSAYGQQTEEVSRITESLRIQEDRIGISRQLGATTELSSLVQLGTARSAAVNQMQAMVQAQEAIAAASGNPALVLAAQRARVELEKLAATADPLGDKINGIFSDAAGGALADFINGTKSAKDAFKDFATSVTQQITRMASNSLAESLFGGLFKTNGGSQGGGFNISSLFSSLFGFAGGGNVGPGQLVRVNENGPEMLDYQGKQYLMNGNRNARVIPNGGTGGGNTYYITAPVTASPGVSNATAMQQGAAYARGLRTSLARNG